MGGRSNWPQIEELPIQAGPDSEIRQGQEGRCKASDQRQVLQAARAGAGAARAAKTMDVPEILVPAPGPCGGCLVRTQRWSG